VRLHTSRALLVALGVVVTIVGAGPNPTARATACSSPTTQPPSPGFGTFLEGMAVLSDCDAWAVGTMWQTALGNPTIALVLHWNGTSWETPTVPVSLHVNTRLSAVAAISPTDVWAAGYLWNQQTNHWRSLVVHWDGTSWSIVPSPSPGTYLTWFTGLSAVASNDVWASGYSDDGGRSQPLIVHWNGIRWKVVPSPAGLTGWLTDVSATSPTNAWAVGATTTHARRAPRTLIEHWDGRAWTVQPSPNPGTTNNILSAVVGISTTDAWAVGQFVKDGPYTTALIEHWDGVAWRAVHVRREGGANGTEVLEGVAAGASNDVWAVGSVVPDAPALGPGRPVVLHWDGGAWKRQPQEPGASWGSSFFGVAEPPDGGSAWADGNSKDGQGYAPLVVRYVPPA